MSTGYEQKYNDLVAGLEKMHSKNVSRTRAALRSLLIIPTVFLILLFMTESSKTVFLVLWIASMFVIACVLIVIEYQDYLLRKMFTDIELGKKDDVDASLSEAEGRSDSDAYKEAERIRKSVRDRAPVSSAKDD